MTNRELLEQQILEGENHLGYDTLAKLEELRNHYPDRNDIRYQVRIQDGSEWDHESEPTWRIIIHAEEMGGLFGGIHWLFHPDNIPLIANHLASVHKDGVYEALNAYREKVRLEIEEHQREIKRLQIRQNKVETMLDGHRTTFQR